MIIHGHHAKTILNALADTQRRGTGIGNEGIFAGSGIDRDRAMRGGQAGHVGAIGVDQTVIDRVGNTRDEITDHPGIGIGAGHAAADAGMIVGGDKIGVSGDGGRIVGTGDGEIDHFGAAGGAVAVDREDLEGIRHAFTDAEMVAGGGSEVIGSGGGIENHRTVIGNQGLGAVAVAHHPVTRKVEGHGITVDIAGRQLPMQRVLFIGRGRDFGLHGRRVIDRRLNGQGGIDNRRGGGRPGGNHLNRRRFGIGDGHGGDRRGLGRRDRCLRIPDVLGGSLRRSEDDILGLGGHGGLNHIGIRSREIEVLDPRDLTGTAAVIDGDRQIGVAGKPGGGDGLNLGSTGRSGMNVGQTTKTAVRSFGRANDIQPRLAKALVLDTLQVGKIVQNLMLVLGCPAGLIAGLIGRFGSHSPPRSKKKLRPP